MALDLRPCADRSPHQPHKWLAQYGPDIRGVQQVQCLGVKSRHKHKLVFHRRTMYTMTFACVPRMPEEPGYEPDWACNYTTRYDRKWVRALVKGETQLGEIPWLAQEELRRDKVLNNLHRFLGVPPRQSDYTQLSEE